jgi:hypothetical protein
MTEKKSKRRGQVPLGTFTRDQWSRILAKEDETGVPLRGMVLEVAGEGDWSKVLDYLKSQGLDFTNDK